MQSPLKHLRTDLGLTQEAFGAKVGISQVRVSELENGAPLTSDFALRVWDRFKRRLKHLGYSLEDLLRTNADSDGAAA